MRKLLSLIVFVLAFAASAWGQNPSAGIIATNRTIDFSAGNAGVVGGIPSGSWSQCGSTVTAGTSAATINSLLAACGNNTYLLLGPGTFNLSSSIDFSHLSHRVVRGSGANSTFLNYTGSGNCISGSYVGNISITPEVGVCMAASGYNTAYLPGDIVNWVSGFTQGSTSFGFAIPTYSAGTYQTGSIVLSGGTYYRCQAGGGPANCTDAPPNADWGSLGTSLSAPPDLAVGSFFIVDQVDNLSSE